MRFWLNMRFKKKNSKGLKNNSITKRFSIVNLKMHWNS